MNSFHLVWDKAKEILEKLTKEESHRIAADEGICVGIVRIVEELLKFLRNVPTRRLYLISTNPVNLAHVVDENLLSICVPLSKPVANVDIDHSTACNLWSKAAPASNVDQSFARNLSFQCKSISVISVAITEFPVARQKHFYDSRNVEHLSAQNLCLVEKHIYKQPTSL